MQIQSQAASLASQCRRTWNYAGCPKNLFFQIPLKVICLKENIWLLGFCTWVTQKYILSYVTKLVTKTETTEGMINLNDSQVGLYLLRSCVSGCKINPTFFEPPPKILKMHHSPILTLLSELLWGGSCKVSSWIWLGSGQVVVILVPTNSLGLVMIGSDFIIPLQIFLGINEFPKTPALLCACL